MNDQPTLPDFGVQFDPNTIPPAEEKKSNGRRGRRSRVAARAAKKKGRPPKAQAVPEPVAGSPVAGRRPRKVRAARIDLAVALSALSGLTEDDAGDELGVVQSMQAFSGVQRKRIAQAIGKLFA